MCLGPASVPDCCDAALPWCHCVVNDLCWTNVQEGAIARMDLFAGANIIGMSSEGMHTL